LQNGEAMIGVNQPLLKHKHNSRITTIAAILN